MREFKIEEPTQNKKDCKIVVNGDLMRAKTLLTVIVGLVKNDFEMVVEDDCH